MYAAAKHWSTLPCDICVVTGSNEFKKQIRDANFHIQ